MAAARKQARAFLLDPTAALKQAGVKSFNSVADEFITRRVSKLRTQREVRRVSDRYLRPGLGDRQFEEIKRLRQTHLRRAEGGGSQGPGSAGRAHRQSTQKGMLAVADNYERVAQRAEARQLGILPNTRT